MSEAVDILFAGGRVLVVACGELRTFGPQQRILNPEAESCASLDENSGSQRQVIGVNNGLSLVDSSLVVVELPAGFLKPSTRYQVTEAPGAQRRVLEFCSFVASQFLAQSFWVPNALNTLQHQPNCKNTMCYKNTT